MNSGAGVKMPANAQPAQQHQRNAERHELEVVVDLVSDTNFYTGLTQNISTGRARSSAVPSWCRPSRTSCARR